MTLQLGWFSTARGPGSRGMLVSALEAMDSGALDARIQFVFSNRERGEGEGSDAYFDLLEARGIPLVAHSSRKFREAHGGDFASHRTEYDAEVRRLLAPYAPDLAVLAGYMLIMSPELCNALPFINLHPALPGGPRGTWQEVIWRLIDDWAIENGCMVHLVTKEVDQGAPIAFTRFPLRGWRFDPMWMEHGDRTAQDVQAKEGEEYPLFQAIRQEGVVREPHLLLETLKAFARGDIRILDRQVVDTRGGPVGPPVGPIDLTSQVESGLAQTHLRGPEAPS